LTVGTGSGTLDEMPSAYCDTMMYDRIAKGETSREEVEAVVRAQTRGQLTVYPSVMDVEELLGQWKTRRPEALLRLRKMRDTVGFSRMLKQPSDLLKEAILAYADGREAPPVTFSSEDQARLSRGLHGILDGDDDAEELVPRILADVRAIKGDFPRWWCNARDRVHKEFNWWAIPVGERRRLNFAAFFASGAAGWAEDFAASLGADVADACRARGVDGLLALRPVRLCIGASMALVFDTTFGDGVQLSEPKPGDAYDFWHAIAASAADIFVTDDRPFTRRLKQVPMDGFRVVGSLRELLDLLDGPAATTGGVAVEAIPAGGATGTAPR
jgi:hypothetical protein